MTSKDMHTSGARISRRFAKATLLAASIAACFGATVTSAYAAADDSTLADAQIAALLTEKAERTSVQQKLGSQLWYTLQASRGQAMPGLDRMYESARSAVKPDADGRAKVTISGTPSRELLARIPALGGTVHYASMKHGSIVATLPLKAMELLAASADVRHISPAARARTNVGAITSQGYITHAANQVVNGGHDGTGVRVGVLSDSVEALAALISSGDLPANTTVVPGQEGAGESEGTAMMEIVHDLAPGAQLFFATAFNGEDSFADNIRTLRDTYHCDIIVDDVTYFDEGVFQDGEVAQAVNDVVADGALYFSAAANSGNLTSGTSGTWEGDFKFGGIGRKPLPSGYRVHDFGGQNYDVLTVSTAYILAKWSDPLGASSNDYDLFVLDPTGKTIECASTDAQTGASDPLEFCEDDAGFAVNSRIVIAKHAHAAKRALHLDTERGAVSIGTSGATFGHNAGLNTVSTAATYWNSAGTGATPFVGGAANPTETFSSDGPRKIFYQPDGTPITPGNVLFNTNGGTTLAKPDITAADGVATDTPGFLPFFGTSAAAPHAAAVAALVKSARPDYTNVQILNAMKATALDIRAPGVDRDAGSGIVMAPAAVNYAITH